jgi:purine-nucleoside phosphorylase
VKVEGSARQLGAAAAGDTGEALAAIRRALAGGAAPEVGIVTGSGLAAMASGLTRPTRLAFEEMPGWPVPAVPGHPGELGLGELGGVSIAVALGRSHLYEGRSSVELAFGVRVLAELGVRAMIFTNAAGALDQELAPGDVMALADHLFLPGLAGASPLVGGALGEPRFPEMVDAYVPRLRDAFVSRAREAGLRASEGIYAMVAGPSFETPAEARMLRVMGADAVGMSKVPEVVVARQLGLRVLAISVIANRVALEPGAGHQATLHDEVLAASESVAPRLAQVIERMLVDGAFAD